jgi:hypothetical protein
LKTAGNRRHGTTYQKPLTMFAETEKPLLKPLPDVPVQIATWTQVKVHGNCHVQFKNPTTQRRSGWYASSCG